MLISEQKNISAAISDVKCDVSSDVVVTLGDASVKKKRKNTLTVQIPQGFPLSDVYNGYAKNKKRGSDLVAYVVSHLVSRNQQRRQPINEFVPLSSAALRNMFGGDYSKYINSLTELNLFEAYSKPYDETINNVRYVSKGTYSLKFKKAKKYRLNVSEGTPVVDYIITDKQVIRKINDARVKQLERLIRSDKTAEQIYQSIKLLSIDYDAAIEYTRTKYELRKIYRLAKSFLRQKTKEELREFYRLMLQSSKNKKKREAVLKKFGISDLTWGDAALHYCKQYSRWQARVRWIRTIKAIAEGHHEHITMVKDKYSGRIYNTLTLTPSDIRSFMYLDGQPLVEFDGANAQWKCFVKLCNILCRPSLYSDVIGKYGIEKTPKEAGDETTSLNMLHNFMQKYGDVVQQESDKLDRWTNEDNILREYIAAEMQRKGKQTTCKQAKGYLIKNVLFGNPNNRGYMNFDSVKLFRKEFPTLFDLLLRLKKYWLNEVQWGYASFDIYKRPLKWKAFPRLLQFMEAEVFVSGMKGTNAHFITLHDAIITNQKGAAEVNKRLQASILKHTNGIKLKYQEYEKSI